MIDGDKVGIWDGVVTIIYARYKVGNGNTIKYKVKELYPLAEQNHFLTLNDCLRIIGCNHKKRKGKIEIVTVILDDASNGEIYKYGNYSEPGWTLYGTTKGYY
jgi:hypothetical protein